MISNTEGWHYLAASKLSALFSEIMPKLADNSSLNCLHLLRTTDKLKSLKKEHENKDFRGVIMLFEVQSVQKMLKDTICFLCRS